MNRKLILVGLIIIAVFLGVSFVSKREFGGGGLSTLTDMPNLQEDGGSLENDAHALSIEKLRGGEYPGSDVVIEETLSPGSNYQRYIASYQSEGLKIYALLTVPNGDRPTEKWPVIIFNHGYIPPAQYRTTERYIAYVDGFARNGYIVFRPDYRGHGNSEGEASGAYGSSAYIVDVLNAVSSIKKYEGADAARVGMWGHSLGGFITLRNMVISKDVKAGVIWAGVVGSYPDLLNNWRRRNTTPPPGVPSGARRWRQELVEKYGEPEENPEFWNSISANSYLGDISGPLQLHHGTSDASVPVEFSQKLEEQMKTAGKPVELFTYNGDDHNLSKSFSVAMQRSVAFFDRYLK
ncbi:MAG: alpha/beta fold hydrolase [bacterium]|nr:alpha/beta fold hydrolase [bacterium]